ncbi:MAG TPA: FumA C-terminus/TtdB family hydratase beta subunit [Candidatus Brocadiia bacterium]|nr:FumA C-terminus/TtdB family hydratase beta subunit [Candidatus Brocadiia bacterium]
MAEIRDITTPLSDAAARELRAGERVRISGTIYTMRDAAHARLIEMLDAGKPAPFDLRGAAIYYAGAAPAPPGRPIGPVGPTTSVRMDKFTPRMLSEGVKLIIGKGPRGPEVIEALGRSGAVYCAATGGAAVLIAQCVRSAEVIAFPDLLSEAIRRLEVVNFPAIIAVDAAGNEVFESGRQAARELIARRANSA